MSDTPITRIQRASSAPRETPGQRARKKKNQITIGCVIAAAMIAIGFYVQSVNPRGAFIWVTGLALGYVLQRSRFCFTASLRDPVLTGTTSLTKAVIIALSLASLGYMALQMQRTGMDLSNFGTEALPNATRLPGHVRDAGVHTILGGFIFGMGAVIAGGCASGTFMRMGEGFVQQWIAVIFFIAGSVMGIVLLPFLRATGFLYQSTPVYLPQALGGWFPAVIVQFGLLFGLYVLADWYGKKKSGEI